MASNWKERIERCEGFQWDSANFGKVWDRHRVTPVECEDVFFNQPLILGEARGETEERLYALGQTEAARRLFVVFTIRANLIRVISARDMSRKERRIYDQT